MQIYPAIDIKNGQCVRLQQCDFNRSTVFNEHPHKVAMDWEKSGATYLHIADLDSAKFGSGYNDEIIRKIIENVNIPIQVGGGIKTMRDIENRLAMGISRVVIGTAAICDPAFIKEALKQYANKIVIVINARDGMVSAQNWEPHNAVSALNLCRSMADIGINSIIYTDVAKDGMMLGPNISATKEIVETTRTNVIASGGVSSMKDLENLYEINVSGVIIGRALYQGCLQLTEIIRKFQNNKEKSNLTDIPY